ncbi:MAG: hypothetical protein H6682_07500 [Candidatus Eisenbacteria bacterium]|nr:hypothetical protein [Candidatus Eisenbacteria bacterium]
MNRDRHSDAETNHTQGLLQGPSTPCGHRFPSRSSARFGHLSLSRLVLGLTVIAAILAGCGAPRTESRKESAPPQPLHETVFLDSLEAKTFRFFWDHTAPESGLSPDRYPTESFVSVAASGFALTAYPIGAERGYVTREQAAERVRSALDYFLQAPQGDTPAGTIGYRGFFYHFLHPEDGTRFETVELSTVDTALFLAGALFCQSYFDGPSETEREIRALADSLYFRVEWDWATPRPPLVSHGWKPEEGHLPYDWGGYSEASILYVLALASPTHPIPANCWEDGWTQGYNWGSYYGQEHLGFSPLFGHQYSHVWIDFRGIQDRYMRAKGIDYFENSRRAVLAQRAYAIENPNQWVGYGERMWGLTACDGPLHTEQTVLGTPRQFETYWARGASFTYVNDDGTIAPTAMAASLPFAPEVVVPDLLAMYEDHPHVWSDYGFLDAFNPSFDFEIPVQHGRVVPGRGWVDTDYLGIDQGPIVAMIENYRTGLVWEYMKRNPHIVRGLRAAGFTGGWLEEAASGSGAAREPGGPKDPRSPGEPGTPVPTGDGR